MNKSKMIEILSHLNERMELPPDNFGLEPEQCRAAIKQLQEQGLLAGIDFFYTWMNPVPAKMLLDRGHVTLEGLQYIDNCKVCVVDLQSEFISACAKIADNPASYISFDEDGLNREIRNLLDSAIGRFGYSVCDQTQQGLGKNERKPGELDIRIVKDGIPVAIYEGLIHRDRDWLVEHIWPTVGATSCLTWGRRCTRGTCSGGTRGCRLFLYALRLLAL